MSIFNLVRNKHLEISSKWAFFPFYRFITAFEKIIKLAEICYCFVSFLYTLGKLRDLF